jgi:hypothetical protein
VIADRIEATATLASTTVIPPQNPFPSCAIRLSADLPAVGRIALKLDESAGGATITVDVPAQLARRAAAHGAPTRWRVTIEPEVAL